MEWEWDLGAFVSCASRCVRLWADSFVGGVLLAMICRLRTSEELFPLHGETRADHLVRSVLTCQILKESSTAGHDFRIMGIAAQ